MCDGEAGPSWGNFRKRLAQYRRRVGKYIRYLLHYQCLSNPRKPADGIGNPPSCANSFGPRASEFAATVVDFPLLSLGWALCCFARTGRLDAFVGLIAVTPPSGAWARRKDRSRNEISFRARSTESSIGVRPSKLVLSRSAPRLIASRAVNMSPRLMASNKASVGGRSVVPPFIGTTVSGRAFAPGMAAGGGNFSFFSDSEATPPSAAPGPFCPAILCANDGKATVIPTAIAKE